MLMTIIAPSPTDSSSSLSPLNSNLNPVKNDRPFILHKAPLNRMKHKPVDANVLIDETIKALKNLQMQFIDDVEGLESND